jgi:hypothetical protein
MRNYFVSAVLLLSCLPTSGVDGFNQPGFDYDNFEADSFFLCRHSCGGDSRCQPWTWVKPGIQGRKAGVG